MTEMLIFSVSFTPLFEINNSLYTSIVIFVNGYNENLIFNLFI